MSSYRDLDITLLELLPPWYRDILDYQEICKDAQTELDALAAAIRAVYENFFLQSMDVSNVEQWESIFRIIPQTQSYNYKLGIWELGVLPFSSDDPSKTETLDFRRQRIINRLSTRPPFTLSYLYQKLDEIIGEGLWTVTVDYPNYTLYVESAAENQFYATELAVTIGQIKPAHIVFRDTPVTTAALMSSEEISAAARRWNYTLGTWALGGSPFLTIYSPEVVKVADTPSIKDALLSDVANFISSDVVSARINGTVAIAAADITKSVADNILTVTYLVSMAQTTEIVKAELLDANGVVLTASSVYVPVGNDGVLMKHKIPVKEGV